VCFYYWQWGSGYSLGKYRKILGAFNPKWVKPGIAVEGTPKSKDIEQAERLGGKSWQKPLLPNDSLISFEAIFLHLIIFAKS
jgi:hypothetical protein